MKWFGLLKNKKAVGIITGVVIGGSVLGVMALNAPATGGADTSPLVQQVDDQGKRLANHEARITNTENDVKDLQTGTNTAPSTTRVEVPVSTGTAPASTPLASPPAAVTVVSYEQIPIGDDTDCKYTYSDGTTYQWHWKTVNPQGSWQTDGSGNNGHWVSTIQTSGYCDNRALGQQKV